MKQADGDRPRRRAGTAEGRAMKARVGDQLITEGAEDQRSCVIIGLHRADGSPPYVVRWLTDGHIALMFPGPYTKLVHPGSEDDAGTMEHSRPLNQAPGR
jgi:Domain of unknown function (DUF1918)